MKRFYICYLFTVVLTALMVTESKGQCGISSVEPTYYRNSEVVTTWCASGTYSVKLENLTDGATYTLSYPGYSNSRTFWNDLIQNGQPVTSFSWSLGNVTSSLHFVVNAELNGCSGTVLENTITVGTPDIGLTLTSSHPDPGAICSGQGTTLNLSVTGSNVNYLWYSKRANGQPIDDLGYPHSGTSYTPTDGAEYWVKGTGVCGATAESDHIVVAFVPQASNASLVNPAISGTGFSRCKGSGSTVYNASGNNATQYEFEISGSGNTISPIGRQAYNGGTVSATASWANNFVGTAIVKVTFYGCNGSTSFATNTATSNVISPATLTLTGNSQVCPYDKETTEITLVSNSSTGYLDDIQYKLLRNQELVGHMFGHSNDEATSPVSTLSWQPTKAGTYTVVATGYGCTDEPMNGSVVIAYKTPGTITLKGYTTSNPVPIESNFNICSATQDQVTLTVTGSSEYTWYADRSMQDIHNFDEHLVKSQDIEPYQTGVFWVIGKENICNIQVQSNSIGVNINDSPNAGITPSGVMKVASYSVAQTISVQYHVIGNSYQWLKYGEPIPGEIGNSITVNETGSYTVRVTSPNGTCQSTTGVSFEFIKNRPPIVNAGEDKTITLPSNSVTLNGSAIDPDGGTVLYYRWEVWEVLTYGSQPVLSGDQTADLSISGLHPGTYTYRLEAVDDMYERGYDDVTLTVITPAGNYNWIKERTALVEGITTEAEMIAAPVGDKSFTWTYYDGLARPIQSVVVQGSPLHLDVTQPVQYDAQGRESKKYLPYVSDESNGEFKIDAFSNQGTYYQNTPNVDHDIAFSQTIFDSSPLNRVMKLGAPGTTWQPIDNNPFSINDNTIKKRYEFNQSTDGILNFNYDETTGSISNQGSSEYEPNTLFANKTLDEKNYLVVEYMDKEGKIICKKVQSSKPDEALVFAETYYIYDDLGNLVLVLPPEAVKKLKTALNLN